MRGLSEPPTIHYADKLMPVIRILAASRSALSTCSVSSSVMSSRPMVSSLGRAMLGAWLLSCSHPSASGEQGQGRAELGRSSAELSSLTVAPDTLAFDLNLEGRPFRLTLERTPPPLADGYKAFQQRADGTLVPLPSGSNDCSYSGRAESLNDTDGAGPGFASVNVCPSVTGQPLGQAVAGIVRAEGRFWRLTPDAADADPTDGIEHWLQPLHRPDTLGIGAETPRHEKLVRAESEPRRLEFREGTPEETKYIDLVVVSDASRVARLGGRTEAEGIAFVEAMNAILADSGLTPRLRVTLRAQVLFDQDPYQPNIVDGEVDHKSLLRDFLAWGGSTELPPHDEHMLLSGRDFLENTVGFAGLEVACSPGSNGFIVQADADVGDFAVLSGVHELGHTVGMKHDDGAAESRCDASQFIMAAVGCVNCERDDQFSPCSVEQFNAYLDGPAYAGGAFCANDVPAGSAPICGDGSVSEGETCDCGAGDCSGVDPCCDGNTCQLVEGAACSDFNDGCCQGCQVVSAEPSVVCRAQRSTCDIAEVCTGATKDCPADDFEEAGGDCTDDRGNPGSCYFGDCRSRGSQCEQIAEQEHFDGFGTPSERCGSPCSQVVCGNGPNGCVIIQGPSVIDGVSCGGGQCVAGQCVQLVDQCPDDGLETEPGECGCGVADGDIDGDGDGDASDCADECPEDASKRAPGACGCGVSDTDSDGDGAADCRDACPEDTGKQAPGACGCGQPELDSDSDGTADCIDGCPDDARSVEVGACGCGVAATDADDDGTPDCVDACPEDGTRAQTPCGPPTTGRDNQAASFDTRDDDGGCALAPAADTRSTASMLWLLAAALPLVGRRQRRTPAQS
jgi:hypothetical protein